MKSPASTTNRYIAFLFVVIFHKFSKLFLTHSKKTDRYICIRPFELRYSLI